MLSSKWDANCVEQPPFDRFYDQNVDVLKKMLKESSQDTVFDDPTKFLPQAETLDQRINMRGLLIDWLKQVNVYRKSKPGLLALTVEIIDRYIYNFVLKKHEISVNAMNYQCVGASAYYIASKMEEVTPVNPKDLSKFTSESCSISDITDMEIVISFNLNFDFKFLTSVDFIYFLMNFVELPELRRNCIRDYAVDHYICALNNCDMKRYSIHIRSISCIALGYNELEDANEDELRVIVKKYLDLIDPDLVQLRSCYKFLSEIIVSRTHNQQSTEFIYDE